MDDFQEEPQTRISSLTEILDAAWRGGFTTKSTIAREHADTIAAAQERNLITVRVGPSTRGRTFYITPNGLTVLWAIKGIE